MSKWPKELFSSVTFKDNFIFGKNAGRTIQSHKKKLTRQGEINSTIINLFFAYLSNSASSPVLTAPVCDIVMFKSPNFH